MIFYSAARSGFFHQDLHAELPADAVRVSPARHSALLAAQARGRRIVAGDDGRPVLAPVVVERLDVLRARKVAAVKREARRRILAIASMERQVNDLALMITDPASADADLARDRRRRIDTIRSASDAYEAAIGALTRDELVALDPSTDEYWPQP